MGVGLRLGWGLYRVGPRIRTSIARKGPGGWWRQGLGSAWL